MSAADAAPPTPLAAHRWHDRVLILFAPAAADPQLAAQEKSLAAEPDGLKARNLHIVRVAGDRVTGLSDPAAPLRRSYDVPPADFAVRLIGKDGHVALARGTPIAVPDLFATIDAMPMRREEMRRGR